MSTHNNVRLTREYNLNTRDKSKIELIEELRMRYQLRIKKLNCSVISRTDLTPRFRPIKGRDTIKLEFNRSSKLLYQSNIA